MFFASAAIICESYSYDRTQIRSWTSFNIPSNKTPQYAPPWQSLSQALNQDSPKQSIGSGKVVNVSLYMSRHIMVCEVRSHKCDIAEESTIPGTTTKKETETQRWKSLNFFSWDLGSGTRIRMLAHRAHIMPYVYVICNMYSNTVAPQIAKRSWRNEVTRYTILWEAIFWNRRDAKFEDEGIA